MKISPEDIETDFLKTTLKHYIVSLSTIIFSISVMIILPFLIDKYLWQIMILPIVAQFPTFIITRKILREHGKRTII